MSIIKTKAKVNKIKNLSFNVREVSFSLKDKISFVPGQFMNFFIEIDRVKEKRAYSICSDYKNTDKISFCIRKVKNAIVSNIFWDKDIIGKEFDIMGPIGLNTVDKLKKDKIYMIAMGVGISPVKSIVNYLVEKTDKEIKLFFGNLNEEQILYKNFFDKMDKKYKNFTVDYILSEPIDKNYSKQGFVQHFLHHEDFNNSSIYICGTPEMVNGCRKEIFAKNPSNVDIIEESFR